MRFRKRPVVIEALQVPLSVDDGTLVAWGRLAYWLGPGGPWEVLRGGSDGIGLRTLEGTMRAAPGDWIIRGVKGELYPCKPDVFEKTYEPVEG